jgi:hypothetical protein
MRLPPLIFGAALVAQIASANPIAVLQQVYIADEKLLVHLTSDHADIDCHLLIKSVPGQVEMLLGADAEMLVPVWLPHAQLGNKIKRLDSLRQSVDRRKNPEAEAGLVRLCGLNISIDGAPAVIDNEFLAEKQYDGVSQEVFVRGFDCLLYSFSIPAKACRKGVTVVLRWRQLLDGEPKKGGRFFYLPILPNHSDGSLKDPSSGSGSHRAVISCAKDISAALAWGKDATRIGAGQTSTLPLSHLSPIKLLVISENAP